jgi:hypothetical protein
MRALLCCVGPALLTSSVQTAETPKPKPGTVMIVGTFHMANPGLDLHKVLADDMLSDDRQKQIAAVTAGLERFKPTMAAVERPAETTVEPYAQYRAGTLKPAPNEVVQLGFRLANAAKLERVAGIDVQGDFPYEPADDFAKAHGKSKILSSANRDIEAYVQGINDTLKKGTVADVLRYLNDPVRMKGDNGFYRTMLRVGAGAEQPGVDLLTAWYRRNFLICANLAQIARPGDV